VAGKVGQLSEKPPDHLVGRDNQDGRHASTPSEDRTIVARTTCVA
jgi:hypothetical protein